MSSINLEDLSIHNEEGEEGFSFDFEEDGEEVSDMRWCLLGRLLCDRPIHANSLMIRMADLWSPVKKVSIKEAKPGIFLFQFGHPLDMEAVIKGGPWTFDNYLLILEQIPLGMQIESIPLQHVDLWVQIHNLPIGLMKEKVGITLSNFIGKFVEYDQNNKSSFWRQYMRVKVRMDVHQPLKKDTRVKNIAGEWCTVNFKYEKLGIFCFVCGIMGHTERRCAVRYDMEVDNGIRGWSSEIRAELRKQGGRQTSRWLQDNHGGSRVHDGSSGSQQQGENEPNIRAGPTHVHESATGVNNAHVNQLAPATVESQSSKLVQSSSQPQTTNHNRPITIISPVPVSQSPISPRADQKRIKPTNMISGSDIQGSSEEVVEKVVQAEKKRRREEEKGEVKEHSESIRVLLKYEACLTIDVEGRSGGLCVMWKDSVKCQVMNYSRNFINIVVEDEEVGKWRLTCYYGYPERSRRKLAWDMLRDLRNMSQLPWCIIGDFNDLLSQEDRRGVHPHPNWLCSGFRNAVADCNLTDIYLEGHPYTWNKSRGTTRAIEERLDRALANSLWLSLFPNAKLEDDVDDVVATGWRANRESGVVDKLACCAENLYKWGRRKKIRFKDEVAGYEAEMARLRGESDMSSMSRYHELRNQHAKVLVQEESFWKQRAKMHWLRGGDLNTKFFHASATARTKFKKIEKLVSDENVSITNQQGLCEVAHNYFEQLFKSKVGAYEPVLSLISPRVTLEDNERLVAPITREELRNALFQMHPDKSPGPDGFNPAFFQHFWGMCGEDIFQEVTGWLDRGFFPSSMNETNICLIPKCDRPNTMRDYRPISLCNVLYKMVSKVLANRLKFCLDSCVSEEQSAFIEGGSITDNALIAIEIIHYLKRKTRGYKGELALKIDISKAYDRVEWGFLKGMLTKMGFSEKWIRWMMLCVSSVNYSVLMNFERVGPIHPGRGLRQGDPLSPYLFILVAEGLTSLINKAVAQGDLHGVKICRGAPMVSHLLFADDCFLFCRANLSESRKLMEVLKVYEDVSGQEINLSKSEVFFSRNISQAAQEDLSRVMGVRHVLGTGTYLGLPSLVGRSKKATFAYIKDRIWKKINSWRRRPMSKAGKEVMIKSVLQAIPSYVMSIYLLPDTLVKEIERMINAFWWGGSTNKGIKWLSWERMVPSKDRGGLGFRDLQVFNLAMVAKQGWKLITEPHALVSRILKARYFPKSSLFDATLGTNPSYVWRGIWRSRQVLMQGRRWLIGDGSKINVMYEPWLRSKENSWISAPQNLTVHNMKVQQLMLPNQKAWDERRILSMFPAHTAGEILDVPLLTSIEADRLIWKEERNGIYSVRSGYKKMMREKRDCREAWTIMGLESVIVPRLQRFDNIRELIFDICAKEDIEVAGRVALLMWSLWRNRNNWLWKEVKASASQVGFEAYHGWEEWHTANLRDSPVQHHDQYMSLGIWQPPPLGKVKCNVDASFFINGGVCGWGWCIRGSEGQFILGGSNFLHEKLNIMEGEAMAIKEAMCEVSQRGFTQVIF
ncbi:hypothetical protein TSUD_358070 [Trifolium subterraneum]|uniref:Reverse transcriptase domain-containing protein n=1 Tax=Trifolium subterraneum TaxID=3900 RepID=A0A2Z6MKH7_TRISU|nr:hypothetical protein TSUD_358070 [Trifolium subterraneum]